MQKYDVFIKKKIINFVSFQSSSPWNHQPWKREPVLHPPGGPDHALEAGGHHLQHPQEAVLEETQDEGIMEPVSIFILFLGAVAPINYLSPQGLPDKKIDSTFKREMGQIFLPLCCP